MVTYILDSSAILRYFDDEPGAARVSEILSSHLRGDSETIVSALHWGEIAGIVCNKRGRRAMDSALGRLSTFGLRIVAADSQLAVRAALIKLARKLPYVDAFGVALAEGSPNRVLVTADFDFKPAARDVTIEFLPVK